MTENKTERQIGLSLPVTVRTEKPDGREGLVGIVTCLNRDCSLYHKDFRPSLICEGIVNTGLPGKNKTIRVIDINGCAAINRQLEPYLEIDLSDPENSTHNGTCQISPRREF